MLDKGGKKEIYQQIIASVNKPQKGLKNMGLYLDHWFQDCFQKKIDHQWLSASLGPSRCEVPGRWLS